MHDIYIGVAVCDQSVNSESVCTLLSQIYDQTALQGDSLYITTECHPYVFYKSNSTNENTDVYITLFPLIIREGGKYSINTISTKVKTLVLIYDVTNRETFNYVKGIADIYVNNNIADPNISMITIAMKCEKVKDRVITREEAEDTFNRINVHGFYLLHHELFGDYYIPIIRESVFHQIFKHHNNTYINQPSLELTEYKDLNIDRIKLLSSPYISNGPSTSPSPPRNLQIHLFQTVFKSLVTKNHIFKMVVVIHRQLGLRSCKLNSQDSTFWLSCPKLYHMIAYRQKYNYLPIKINIESDEFCQFLRINKDLNLFQQCYPSKPKKISFLPIPKPRNVMDNACIGGVIDIVNFLYKEEEYQFTNKSFFLAVVFGHLQLLQFIIVDCGFLDQESEKKKKLSDTSRKIIDVAIELATTFQHLEIIDYLKGLAGYKPSTTHRSTSKTRIDRILRTFF